jgi:hypothetical protein
LSPGQPKHNWPWPKDLRQASRTGVQNLRCDLGEIIDFSHRGMRLAMRRRWRPGQRREIVLRGYTGEMLVAARGVWARREGWRQHIVGVAFEDLDPQVEWMLRALAESHAAHEAARRERAAA